MELYWLVGSLSLRIALKDDFSATAEAKGLCVRAELGLRGAVCSAPGMGAEGGLL